MAQCSTGGEAYGNGSCRSSAEHADTAPRDPDVTLRGRPHLMGHSSPPLQRLPVLSLTSSLRLRASGGRARVRSVRMQS